MISKEKLVEIIDDELRYEHISHGKFADRILAALKEEQPVASTGESLAELAIEKNYSDVKISQLDNPIAKWLIEFHGYPPYAGIYAQTYAECEAKAVAFLNTLPDTKGGK